MESPRSFEQFPKSPTSGGFNETIINSQVNLIDDKI